MSEFYDKDGTKIDDVLAWAKKVEDYDYKRVGEWKGRRYRISTVWLGIDHSFGQGPLLIFETMVFELGSSRDLDMMRYSTLAEAEQGHKDMINKWRRKDARSLFQYIKSALQSIVRL